MVPESVTESPSYATWLDSAWTANPAGPIVVSRIVVSRTVTVTRSDAELVPSVAVRVKANVTVLSTCGASNVTVRAAESPGSTGGSSGEVWLHWYIREPGDAPVAVPVRVTVSPSSTSCGLPASTTSGVLGAVPRTSIVTVSQLLPSSNTAWPDAVTLTS